MKVLVTGAGGFSGRHLIQYLAGNPSADIYSTSLTRRDESNWLACDLTNRKETAALIAHVAPDQIYHLAGVRSNDYQTDYSVNVSSSLNLLESIATTKARCRVFIVGSSAEYGLVAEGDNPIKEDHPLNPMSVYGLSKVYQTYLMKFYCSRHGMDIVMARPFNLLGKGISGRLFVGHVYEQIEAYKAGRISKILVGTLDHRRDYVPVEEAVRYYALIMQRGKAGEVYNVGSGVSIRIRDLLRRILEENGLSIGVVEEQASKQGDAFDIKDLVADISKLETLAASPTKTIARSSRV
jgi:nucleoside-diphosphate-sugar epimerase